MSDQFNQAGGASEGAKFDSVYESVLLGDGDTEAGAKTKAKRIARSKGSVTLTMPGTTSVVAGAVVNLQGFRPGVSGRYKIKSVTHSLSRSGWTTKIDCELA